MSQPPGIEGLARRYPDPLQDPASALAGAADLARPFGRWLALMQSGMAPSLWQEGSTLLLDYRKSSKPGRPILVVPSLINRGYILDLLPERSFMAFLAGEGFRPFLVDWQSPGEAERRFDLGDYILGRL